MASSTIFGRIRRGLDLLYKTCGVIAAGFLLLMLGIIVAQMMARWTGTTFPGSTDYAGYCMAAASFFALAYALNHGAHIRVNLLLSRLGHFRKWGEIWCFTIATGLPAYFAYFGIKANYMSHKLNDISQGQDATPLWIPQIAMSVGTAVLTLALADHLVRLFLVGTHGIVDESLEDHHVE